MEHLEGRESVLAALQAHQRSFQLILLRYGLHPEKAEPIRALAAQRGIAVREVEPRELDAMAHGATHGGVLAICSAKPRLRPEELLERAAALREPALLLALEGIDDARNLGFTLRSADAFGAQAVLIKKHLWDFDPVEIARPASGAYERMALVQFEDVQLLRQLARIGIRTYGCLAGARRTLYDVDLTQPVVLAIGGEKRGLSGALRAVCHRFVTIPTRPGAASLSLSHAAGIVLAEASRQRRTLPAEAAADKAGDSQSSDVV